MVEDRGHPMSERNDPRTVKVGPRGRHFVIPDGYERVTDGLCRYGDYFVNRATIQMEPVDQEDVGIEAAEFDCLLRPRRAVAERQRIE